jgi:hypothetical protein
MAQRRKKQSRKVLAAWTLAFSLALLAAAPRAEAACVAGARSPAGPCGPGGDLCCGSLSPGAQLIDSDGDGFGNYCDGDFNQDCVVGNPDILIASQNFGAPACALPPAMKFDLDRPVPGPPDPPDGIPCGLPDLNRLWGLFGKFVDP